MATFISLKDPRSKSLDELFENLETTPGTCIFIDIIDSTADKYICTPLQWIRKLNNTFNFISLLNDFPNFVVKGIGDELMLFLPDKDLLSISVFKNYYMLLLEIYATLDNLKNHPLNDLFYECKVGIHYCTNVYNITFFEGVNDYYGSDIDLAARIMKKAQKNSIVVSESFYDKVIENMKLMDEVPAIDINKSVSEPFIEHFKGVPHSVVYRMIEVGEES